MVKTVNVIFRFAENHWFTSVAVLWTSEAVLRTSEAVPRTGIALLWISEAVP